MRTQTTRLMIEKCAEAIEKVVVPKLSEAFIAEQALGAAKLLQTLAPNVVEDEWLRKDNAKMRDVLQKVVEWIRKEGPSLQEPMGNARKRIEGLELKKADMDLSEENYNLRLALVETIRGLGALAKDTAIGDVSPLRRRIHRVLREQVDHELAWVGGRRTIGDAVAHLKKAD